MLPGISTEQLRSRLNRMVADGLLTRQRYREVPPRVDYELTERSRELMPVLGALARWGYDWTWTGPRSGEDVNLGAIFRLAPGLMTPPPDVRRQRRPRWSTAAARTSRTASSAWRRRRPRGDLRAARRPGRRDRRRHGGAWISALGPDGSIAGLDVRGRPRARRGAARGVHRGRGRRGASAPGAPEVDDIDGVRSAVGGPHLASPASPASRARAARRRWRARPVRHDAGHGQRGEGVVEQRLRRLGRVAAAPGARARACSRARSRRPCPRAGAARRRRSARPVAAPRRPGTSSRAGEHVAVGAQRGVRLDEACGAGRGRRSA